ncbi:hypothetical protein GJA_1076 [Janthinobacterium agaricidamnosum NBRC 102515 = DSM 9628]|uniref:Uncharacterized protein n=1 Tax=Janthinobacterium agaricidamnosum NBRC 102515 = DSM 9628 TaxID=1349767 RepID=W0V1H3_9BURK|nr:hypothetical protein GJA_1076 [Janthinobacterium agaricidamnosum NBRC 102515 = DSM 9628]
MVSLYLLHLHHFQLAVPDSWRSGTAMNLAHRGGSQAARKVQISGK